MISPDTNVLVRILTEDDEVQAGQAADRLSSGSFWIAKTVLLETEWVLRGAYSLPLERVNRSLRNLLGLTGASVEDPLAVQQALDWHLEGMDFADALHLASSRDTERFVTFDQALIRRAGALRVPTPVEQP